MPFLYILNTLLVFVCCYNNRIWGHALVSKIKLNKSENATLQLSIFYEKVLDKKYLLKLNNVAQTSSKRFVEPTPICLV